MTDNIKLNITVGYNGDGFAQLQQNIRTLQKAMGDIQMPTMVGKRTIFGQMSSDVRSLGNAAEKAAPKLREFQRAMNKFDHRAVSTALGQIERVSDKTRSSVQGLIDAQKRLNQNLQSSTSAYKNAEAAAKAYAAAKTAEARMMTAENGKERNRVSADSNRIREEELALRKKTQAEKQALDQQKQTYRESQRAIKQVNDEQAKLGRFAQAAARTMVSSYRSVINIVRQLANIIRNTLTSAIRSTANSIASFSSSAASRFATLRSQLDATAKSFLNLDRTSRSAGNAFVQMWSGDALIRTGRSLLQITNQGNMLLRQTYSQFADTEQAVSRAAVAGIDPVFETDSKGNEIYRDSAGNIVPAGTAGARRNFQGWSDVPMDDTWNFLYQLQRGQFGTTPIRSLTTTELADATYYLTSALGVNVGTGVGDPRSHAIAEMIGPMAIFASATQTSPEAYIKGVLGIGQQFGFNPRDFANPTTGNTFAGISGMVALLANMSSMEPTDVVNAMRMVGPSSFLSFGGMEAMEWDPHVREKALFDTFIAMFAASEVGLRGSQTGRAYQRVFSGFSDPTPKTRRLLADAFGFDPDEYDEWMYNERGIMDFGGRGEGILGVAKLLQEYRDDPNNTPGDLQKLLAGLFTENATRGMAATLAGMDSSAVQELIDVVEEAQRTGDWTNANELLSKVMQQESALISNAVTNMQNAWGQFANTVFRTSSDQIIGGLDTISNVFRELADIVMDFPALGQGIAAAFSGLLAGGAILGSLLVTVGTLVSLHKALMAIGLSAGIFVRALFSIPMLLARIVPMLALVIAASMALKAAWDNNFLGIRDGVTNLVTTLKDADLSGMLVKYLFSDQGQNVLKWIGRVNAAFRELVVGVLFNIGPLNNLHAMLITIFGDVSGSAIFAGLDSLRGKLVELRGAIVEFFNSVGDLDLGSKLADMWGLGTGLLDVLFTGDMGDRGLNAAERVGEWLGVDNFSKVFQEFAASAREGFSDAILTARAFASELGQVFSNIGDNLKQVFTLDNLVTALQAAFNFAKGFAAGLAVAFYGAVRAVDTFTRALANIGNYGRTISNLIREVTGLQTSLEGIATTLGVLAGVFVGSRFLAPLLLFNTALQRGAVHLVGFGVGLAGVVFQVLAAVAGFGVLGGILAIVFSTFAAGLGLMFAYTAATEGMGAAVSGLGEAWEGFKEVISNTIENISSFAGVVMSTAADIAGLSSGLITFESVGRAIATVVSAIGYAAAGAVGAVVLIGSALFRIGSEYGPALLNTLRGAAPAFAAIAVGAAGVVAGIGKLVAAISKIAAEIIGAESALVGFAAIAAGIWAAFHLPLLGVILAISGIGLAFLAITSDAESMASSVAGIVGTMPEPWQNAIDSIVMKFAKGMDLIRQMYASLPFVDYAYGPQDSFALAYGVERGLIGPAEYDSFLGNRNYSSRGSHFFGKETYTPEEVERYTKIKDDILFTNEMFNIKIGDPSRRSKYLPYGEFSGGPLGEGVSKEEFLIAQEWALNETVGRDVDNLNRFNAMFNPASPRMLMSVSGEGYYHVSPSTITAGDYYGGNFQTTPMEFLYDTLGMNHVNGILVGPAGKQARPASGSPIAWDRVSDILGFNIQGQEDWENLFKFDPSTGRAPIVDWAGSEMYMPEGLKQHMTAMEAYQKQVEAIEEVNKRLPPTMQLQLPKPPNVSTDDVAAWEAELENARRIAEISEQMTEYLMGMTSKPAAIAYWADVRQGKGRAGGSAASFLTSQWDTISGVVGESEWFNEVEMLADAAVLGVLDKNLYGLNTHEALAPYWERVAAENGIAIEDLLLDVPKWFAPEPVAASAASEIFGTFNGAFTEEARKQFDHFGIAEGWTKNGLDWVDLIDYAASQIMAGKEWDFTDYMRDSLKMSEEEIQQAIDSYDIDFSQISSEWTTETEMLALSMMTGANIISEESLAAAEMLMASGDDIRKTIELTRADLQNLDEGTIRYLTSQGWTFVIVEPDVEVEAAKNAIDAGYDALVKSIENGKNRAARAASSGDTIDGQPKYSGDKRTPPTAGEVTKPQTGNVPTSSGVMIDDQPVWDGTTRTSPSAGTTTGTTTTRPSRTNTVIQPVNTHIIEVEGETTINPLTVDSAWSNINAGVDRAMEAAGWTKPLPSRKSTVTQQVDTHVIEVEGETTVEPLVIDAYMDRFKDGVFSGLDGLGAGKRTPWTRTETVKVNLKVEPDVQGLEDFTLSLESMATDVSIKVGLDPSTATAAMSVITAWIDEQVNIERKIIVGLDPSTATAAMAVTSMWIDEQINIPRMITIGLDPSTAIAALYVTQTEVDSLVNGTYVVLIDGDSIPAQKHIADVARALFNLVEGSYVVTITADDQASSVISTISDALSSLNGTVATTTIRTVRQTVSEDLSVGNAFGKAIKLHAKGGIVSGSDYQIVGEEGPELVKLPWGTTVYPHERSMSMLKSMNTDSLLSNRNVEISDRTLVLPMMESRSRSSQSNERPQVNITFGDVTIHGDQDIEELAEKIDAALAKKQSMAGRGQVSVDFRTYQD